MEKEFFPLVGFGVNSIKTTSSSHLHFPLRLAFTCTSPSIARNYLDSSKMSTLTASAIAIAISAKRPSEGECRGQIKILGPSPVGLCRQSVSFGRRLAIAHTQKRSASLICASALNARCGAEQTQTVTRQSSTITIAPVQGKEKSPELDDGGTGFPPRDDGDGGGGGGGGGGGWAGGFFFFGFLAFLGFLKDKESEGPYRNER